MKRIMVSVTIFIVVFIVSYVGLCYLVPGLRIKLAADAVTYFKESIRHMIFLKSVMEEDNFFNITKKQHTLLFFLV